MRTIDILDAIKKRHGIATDAALGIALGVTKQTVRQYRKGAVFLGEDTAVVAADLLNLPPGQVMAWCHAERAKSPRVREVWLAIAQRAAAVFLAVFIGVSALLPSPAHADFFNPAMQNNVYYVKSNI